MFVRGILNRLFPNISFGPEVKIDKDNFDVPVAVFGWSTANEDARVLIGYDDENRVWYVATIDGTKYPFSDFYNVIDFLAKRLSVYNSFVNEFDDDSMVVFDTSKEE